jgi:hypothetical protein
MERPYVVHAGNGLQVWKIVVNIMDKQSRRPDIGGLLVLGVVELTTPHLRDPAHDEMLHRASNWEDYFERSKQRKMEASS